MANIAQQHTPSILLIYTGGTIGMYENPRTGALENFDFNQLIHYVPEVVKFGYNIDHYSFAPPIDSSDISPECWVQLAHIVRDHYDRYDGFVILHGTDTMSYTASALSFMLENLSKPIILTGSQLPIGQIRTDGKENLLTSIEIAATRTAANLPLVREVCVFFERKLMRGNRTTKVNAQGFNAFKSYNHPAIVEAGTHLIYHPEYALPPNNAAAPLIVHDRLDNNILVIPLFPGIRRQNVEHLLATPNLRAVILKTYGSGNAPQQAWLVELLNALQTKGVIVVNNTQCLQGRVEMERYGTGLQLLKAGVVNGYDSTIESMVTKLMVLLGQDSPREHTIMLLGQSIAGEITLNQHY
ncbi:MAG: type I asparaginase [Bacteroidales bacterium]|nr:type I asparaginase [Bacteroidales bacterium]